MAAPAGRHQPAQPEVGRQRRLHRSPAVGPPSRRYQHPSEDTAHHLHHRVAQVPGQLAERGPSPLDSAILQRSQLRQAAILRRTFVPDATRLPSAPQRPPAIQSGAPVAQSDPRRVSAVRAGTAAGDVLAAAAGRTAQGEVAAEARPARALGAGARGLARSGDFAREQVEQLRFRQQEHLAAESELEERQHGRRVATAALQAAPAAARRSVARTPGSGQGRAHAHTERRRRRQRRRALRVRSGVMHADAHVGLYAYEGGEAADASDPHHPRPAHPPGAHGTPSAAEVQQGKHRGTSTGDEGRVPSVPTEAGEEEAERAPGERVLKFNRGNPHR